MAGSFERGLRVTGASCSIVVLNPALIAFPVLSFLTAASLAGTVYLGAALLIPSSETFYEYLAGGTALFICYFSALFFESALIATAMERMHGREASVADGLRIARSRTGKILCWALLTGTIGVLLRVLFERTGWLGRIAIYIFGWIWSTATFFVLPVIIVGDEPVGPSIKTSWRLFRQRWGEEVTGMFAMSVVFYVLALPFGLLSFGVWWLSEPAGFILGAIALAFLFAFRLAVAGVFKAVLFRFANTGHVPEGFETGDLRDAFPPRRSE